MRYFIIIIWFLLFSFKHSSILSQKLMVPFTITGVIEGVDTGRFKLMRLVDSTANSIIFDGTGTIINEKFTITGKIAYPHAFVANIYKGKTMIPTEMFFIEPGIQYLKGSYDSMMYTVPVISSKTNKEFVNDYWSKYKIVDKLYDLFQKESSIAYDIYCTEVPDTAKIRIEYLKQAFINRRDSLILHQINQNPASFVSLWILAERFFTVGYKKIYEESFNQLSGNIKQTKTGIFLGEHIKTAKLTANGQKFPLFKLSGLDGNNKQLSFLYYKYTLLEFWFSHCGPCIAQFPDLKKVYKNFNGKGFNLVAISTDQISENHYLKAAIKKHELPWQQLWDKNGVETSRLSINSFPTNFLVDNKGTIIRKNIHPAALREFLEMNLSKSESLSGF